MALVDINFTQPRGTIELVLGASPGTPMGPGVTLLQAVKDLWQVHGLDADNVLTVTATSRNAGDVDQTVSGTTTVTVTRT